LYSKCDRKIKHERSLKAKQLDAKESNCDANWTELKRVNETQLDVRGRDDTRRNLSRQEQSKREWENRIERNV